MHNQLFYLAEKPSAYAFEAHGTPAGLGGLAAAWFERCSDGPGTEGHAAFVRGARVTFRTALRRMLVGIVVKPWRLV